MKSSEKSSYKSGLPVQDYDIWCAFFLPVSWLHITVGVFQKWSLLSVFYFYFLLDFMEWKKEAHSGLLPDATYDQKPCTICFILKIKCFMPFLSLTFMHGDLFLQPFPLFIISKFLLFIPLSLIQPVLSCVNCLTFLFSHLHFHENITNAFPFLGSKPFGVLLNQKERPNLGHTSLLCGRHKQQTPCKSANVNSI